MKPKIDGKLVLLEGDNSGRDEMNLAGNPFALLKAASKNGQTFIKHEWERRLPNGKLVNASWEVNGHAELGLPGPSEELLYLVLLQLTREAADENGVWPQTVHFSRRDILDRLGWSGNAREYDNLKNCFARLQAASIQTTYGFYDARTKSPMPFIAFNILDHVQISDETKGRNKQTSIPFSFFKWSDVLYSSFVSGNIRSLALEFTLSLDLTISRRLFRVLEMFRHSQGTPLPTFSIGIFKLRARLGMSDYKYASKIKEKLTPAVEELIERGYLSGVEYKKSKESDEVAYFTFASIGQAQPETEVGRVGEEKTPITPKSTKAKTTKPVRNSKTAAKDATEMLTDVRTDALKCHAIFEALSEREKRELIEIAKKDVNPIWHDRLGQPESPMSLGLWELVAARYPEKLK